MISLFRNSWRSESVTRVSNHLKIGFHVEECNRKAFSPGIGQAYQTNTTFKSLLIHDTIGVTKFNLCRGCEKVTKAFLHRKPHTSKGWRVGGTDEVLANLKGLGPNEVLVASATNCVSEHPKCKRQKYEGQNRAGEFPVHSVSDKTVTGFAEVAMLTVLPWVLPSSGALRHLLPPDGEKRNNSLDMLPGVAAGLLPSRTALPRAILFCPFRAVKLGQPSPVGCGIEKGGLEQ